MGRAPRAFVGTITSVLRGTHLVKIPLSSYVLYAYPGPNHTHDNIPMGWLVCRRESNRILMRILRFGLCALSRTPNRRHHRRRPGKRRGHARRLSTHTGTINQIGRGGVQYSLYRGVEHHSSVKLLPFIHITRINTQIPPFHAKNSDRRSLQTFTAPADHTDDPSFPFLIATRFACNLRALHTQSN